MSNAPDIKFIIANSPLDVARKGWAGCPHFTDPAEAAAAWAAADIDLPLRVRYPDGTIGSGTYEEVKPVLDARRALREAATV